MPMNLEKYLEINPKKILIFDFDGTIATMDIPWYLLEQKLKVLADEFNIAGDHSKGAIGYINSLAEKGDEVFLKRLIRINEGFENEHLRGYEVNKYLVEFLNKYRDNYTFYLWTNNSLKTVQRILGEIGVYEIFSKFITRDSVRLTKPYPEGILEILEKGGEDKSEYIMIGDNPNSDGIASKAAGIEYFKV